MEKFTLQQRLFLYDSYVRYNSARKSQRKFGRKFPGVRIPTRYAIHYLVNKVRKTGVLRDSKPKRRRRVLTEEKLDEIGALFEQSARKSLKRIAQERLELLENYCKYGLMKQQKAGGIWNSKMKTGNVVHVEGDREENSVKQESGDHVENTKKAASKECRQNFEYADVTPSKTETDCKTKEEHIEYFEKFGFGRIKEEVEDEVSVQTNEMCFGVMEGTSLHNDLSVKQVDTLRDSSGIPISGSDDNKTYFCKYAGLHSVLQERDSPGLDFNFSKIDIQISQKSKNKCMELDKKTYEWLHKREEAQRRKRNEDKARKLQKKRDSERSRYSQMTGEERARVLQKKRDAKRNRYSQMAWEEKVRILQKNRDAKRNRYSLMSGDDKARILQKKRDAKRNRYSQMSGDEKARILQKNRDAKRHKYSQMTFEEKAMMLQKKKETRHMRQRQMESTEEKSFISCST
ncbi:uncharacterized protein LOC110830678 isoform X2 [Zootermopsis nevadensis]|uniref:uncharacterized protein LOC110830678 isoform X2 n=1 Tax=Zootermopsis nevadensis TaxID=136037 RepID=UPI000B8EE781|nr:uncharacterized protein LOC110830678 isoform X2 [Zootermopsis nevadensis]